MGRTRGIYFEIDDQENVIDFGTYALMMYYAKQINANKAKQMFNATLSEWKYRVEYNLPTENLDGLEDFEAHFVPSELQEAISFIANEVIPALNNEPRGLIEKYGGPDNFFKLYYTSPDYLAALGLNNNEFYDELYGVKVAFKQLHDLFEYSLSINTPYEIFIR
jgi:hypothetical protein